DADGKRQDGDRGEAGIPGKESHGVAEIAAGVADHAEPRVETNVPLLVEHLVDATGEEGAVQASQPAHGAYLRSLPTAAVSRFHFASSTAALLARAGTRICAAGPLRDGRRDHDLRAACENRRARAPALCGRACSSIVRAGHARGTG